MPVSLPPDPETVFGMSVAFRLPRKAAYSAHSRRAESYEWLQGIRGHCVASARRPTGPLAHTVTVSRDSLREPA